MDFTSLESMESMDKSEFFPLDTIKQELLDAGSAAGDSATNGAETAKNTNGTTDNSNGDYNESANAVCDSAEKQVEDNDKTGASDQAKHSKCVFCSQNLVAKDTPKLLECLHVTCDACITAKFNEIDRTTQPIVVHCPNCNTASRPDSIILDQFLIETSDASSEESQTASDADSKVIKCSCINNNNATSWCVECEEYICDDCVQAHKQLKITKHHKIKSKDEAMADNQSSTADEKTLKCQAHPQEKLSLFCETCDKLTCRDCQLVDHRDHKYKFANEIALETRTNLNLLLKEIDYKRVLLNSAMTVIDDRQTQIADKKKELVEDITKMAVAITTTVNARSKQLVHRLTEVCEGKLKVLNEKKEALQFLSNHTDHCIGFVGRALEKGSDSAVLFSKKTLTQHLLKVKAQRADIPNPEIPVRILVQMNQLPDLQKVISQMGTIVVDGKPYPPIQSPTPPAVRQQASPNLVPNAVNPAANPIIPPIPQTNRSGMPPPSRSPQIPGNINIRNNLYSGNGATPPLQQQQPQQQQPHTAAFPAAMQQQQQQQQQQNQQPFGINRQFSQEGNMPIGPFGRYTNMGPRPANMNPQFSRQLAPHVSSSTHPQNMEKSLRGLLNQGGMQTQMNDFNSMMNQQTVVQQQGLPAQGMQMGNFPMNHQQQQQQHQLLQQQKQRAQQQQQMMQQQQLQKQMMQQQQQQAQQAQQAQQQQRMPPGYPQAPMQPMNNQRAVAVTNDILMQQLIHQNQQSGSPTMNPSMTSGGAQWHIPQSARQANGTTNSNNVPNQTSLSMQFGLNGRMNENSFKIALKPQNTLKQPTPPNTTSVNSATPVPSTVTSTNPKTPSPSTNDNTKDYNDVIDKACGDSVNDLMATIAKLDQNGVQVMPEGQRGKTTSPQVSSTDYLSPTDADKQLNKDDPNEDWCAVCSDGGELMCCDKCPKVFHQHCHIPIINPFPDENEPWQCMLCYNFTEMPLEPVIGDKRSSGLSPAELKRVQRILLELYCQYECSSKFRDVEPETNTQYYEIVKTAITLDIIRSRLDPTAHDRYRSVGAFIADVRLLFNNVYLFYREDSKIFRDARFLEKFFDEQLLKLLPDYITSKEEMIENKSSEANLAKRARLENSQSTDTDDDDDVILA